MAERSPPTRLIITLICVSVPAGLSLAIGGASFGPLPLLTACALLAVGIQWLAFVPAYATQSERFYDLTGSLTYLSVIAFSLSAGAATREPTPRQLLVSLLVVLWAGRLGSFLYRRIQKDGKDGRFDAIKPDPIRFLNAWSIQGVWVFLTALGALILNTRATAGPELGVLDAVGLGVWVVGFGIEVVSDKQKSDFRADPANQGAFINVGLWRWSRHPNYFGEITLWTGILLIAASALEGVQWAAVLSPIFVTLVLTKISGIPMVEKRADEKWGGDEDYEAYKANTPVLMLKPPSRA